MTQESMAITGNRDFAALHFFLVAEDRDPKESSGFPHLRDLKFPR
jgi:hypothetical protein